MSWEVGRLGGWEGGREGGGLFSKLKQKKNEREGKKKWEGGGRYSGSGIIGTIYPKISYLTMLQLRNFS